MSKSPFATFANTTLVFETDTGNLIVDPMTGNKYPEISKVIIRAYLRPDDRPRVLTYVGVDEADLKLVGRLVDPLMLPKEVQQLSRAECEIGKQQGIFTLLYPFQSPFGLNRILGDEIYGTFRFNP